ncbi:MAG: 50S ribosomal protein L15 [Flavobacteriales bacterium]|nr:50S ribosomal protein L15 [Flavobacteriales bacterium]|tara:strand:+ start:306 stop:764 length:459 start_codon:yes stop_codon:yes gene_type:complete
MELHNLKPANGAVKNAKRIGRGEGSKKGGTSTRGHKGAKSRSGYSKKIGFEGGQQPLQRRVPKFGFTNPNRVEYNTVNLDVLQSLYDAKKIKNKVVKDDLIKNGLVQKRDLVKVLARGELKSKLEVTANAFSSKARDIIEKLGGKAIIIDKK